MLEPIELNLLSPLAIFRSCMLEFEVGLIFKQFHSFVITSFDQTADIILVKCYIAHDFVGDLFAKLTFEKLEDWPNRTYRMHKFLSRAAHSGL